MSANDRQIGGDHYKRLDPEPWDVIEAWELGYLLGNAVKYIARAASRGGVADLRKAGHYLEKQMEQWDVSVAVAVPAPKPNDIPRCPSCGQRSVHSAACPANTSIIPDDHCPSCGAPEGRQHEWMCSVAADERNA